MKDYMEVIEDIKENPYLSSLREVYISEKSTLTILLLIR